MSIFGALLYLIAGTTAYLLIFKRDFMLNSNNRAPKVFVPVVSMFCFVAVGFGAGYFNWIVYI